MAEFPDTSVEYLAEYQDGTRARGDDTPGGTWWVAGDIYGYPTEGEARAVLAGTEFDRAQWLDRPNVTGTRILRRTTTVEVVQ